MSDTTQGQNGYPGSVGLTDANDEYNTAVATVREIMAFWRTMLPCKVMAVSPGGVASGGGTVDVQPLVSQVDGTLANPVPHETVYGIPYFRLQGGDSAIVIDPAVGDIGLVHCADRDISGVIGAKGVAPPNSRRRGSFSDGVYVGGILNGAPAQSIAFTSQGVTISDRNGNVITMANGGITITGNITVNGTVTATNFIAGVSPLQVTLLAHIHAANNTPPTPGH